MRKQDGGPETQIGHSTRRPAPKNSYLRAKEGRIGASGAEIGGHVPFPVPDNEEELKATLSTFKGFSPSVVGYFRLKLMAGQLTQAMIEEQQRLAS
ncbi:hypothetical protein [Mesorhizobium sp. 1B3]|uniref:hypothetical protein n=1 Tax=Mesorhizobium sp. 1B3 TaxID=3243599 RepID=UPI003D9729DB